VSTDGTYPALRGKITPNFQSGLSVTGGHPVNIQQSKFRFRDHSLADDLGPVRIDRDLDDVNVFRGDRRGERRERRKAGDCGEVSTDGGALSHHGHGFAFVRA
jgi:hypothetical protein